MAQRFGAAVEFPATHADQVAAAQDVTKLIDESLKENAADIEKLKQIISRTFLAYARAGAPRNDFEVTRIISVAESTFATLLLTISATTIDEIGVLPIATLMSLAYTLALLIDYKFGLLPDYPSANKFVSFMGKSRLRSKFRANLMAALDEQKLWVKVHDGPPRHQLRDFSRLLNEIWSDTQIANACQSLLDNEAIKPQLQRHLVKTQEK